MENYDTYTTTSALLVGIFYFMNKLRIIGKIISINNLYIYTAIYRQPYKQEQNVL